MSSEVSPRVAQLQVLARRYAREAREYAAKVRDLVELERLFADDRDGLILELAGTARMGQGAAAGEVDRAVRLQEHFPRVLELLARGQMRVATVGILLRLTSKCSVAVLDELGRRLPDRLAPLDAADARPLIAQTILEVEGELERKEQQDRYAKARANRGVWVFDVENGMARIGGEIGAVEARRFSLELDELVRCEQLRDKRDGITRTKAQVRADVLAELPGRHLALLQVLATGQGEAVLAEARKRTAEGACAPPPQDELPLGLPATQREAACHLDPCELAVELLRQPLRSAITMHVHSPVTSLLDLDQHPAVIEGLGPIPAWLARTLVPNAALRRVVVNAATGIPLHLDAAPRHRRGHPPDGPPGPGRRRPPAPNDTGPATPDTTPDTTLDTTPAERTQQQLLAMLRPVRLPDTTEPQHDPSTGLRRLVQVRDLRCTGPGCSRTAQACDLDHEKEYSRGGPTSEPNLSAKSPRCHRARHDGWTADRDRTTGITTWTSPAGSEFTRQPAWRPHPWHPEVLHPPLPRLEQLPQAETDYPADRPLWVPQPLPDSTPKAPKPPKPPAPGKGWYDDGTPPPF